jgi:hypothetical protein
MTGEAILVTEDEGLTALHLVDEVKKTRGPDARGHGQVL